MARVSASGLLRTRLLLRIALPSATASRLADVTPRSIPMVRFMMSPSPAPLAATLAFSWALAQPVPTEGTRGKVIVTR